MEELIKKYEEITARYTRLGSSYNDLFVLLEIRTDLTVLFGKFGAYIGDTKFSRNWHEHQRARKIACLIVDIEEEADKAGTKITASKADSQARCHPEYDKFLTEMSQAYSNFETVKHYTEATKLLLFTVGSQLSMLNTEKF